LGEVGEFGAVRRGFGAVFPAGEFFEGAVGGGEEFFGFDGFDEVIFEADFAAFDEFEEGGIAGDGDGDTPGPVGAHFAAEFEAVFAGEVEVEKEDVAGGGLHVLQGFGGIFGHAHFVAGNGEYFGEGEPDAGFIIDDQDVFFGHRFDGGVERVRLPVGFQA
jgi:hypothetical protein